MQANRARNNFLRMLRTDPIHSGNYLTPNGARPVQGGQYDSSVLNYPELQKQHIGQQYPGSSYYNAQQQQPQVPAAGAGPYNPYQYQYPGSYASDAAYGNPYQQGFYPPQAQPFAGSTGLAQPPNAQSILGFLQSIFNFAPGTFGSFPPAPARPGSAYASPPVPGGAGFGSVGGQLRQALDNISENDELQCVPKLICMMSRSSSGQGFSSYLCWVTESEQTSCDAYYPKCPKDEMQILYYLNNHRGGFFRFFNNGDQGQYPQQQQQQQQQYG
uniref:Uncharacterized protein n=1 Tax=Anopheles stephensi TaxID=30069 RepID=A0A182YR32_ANOST